MDRKFIDVKEAIETWQKDPAFVGAYDGLRAEFEAASKRLCEASEVTIWSVEDLSNGLNNER